MGVGTGIEADFEIALRPGSPGQIEMTRIASGLKAPVVFVRSRR
jgi:hypothetical protein